MHRGLALLLLCGCAAAAARLHTILAEDNGAALVVHLDRFPEHAPAWTSMGLYARRSGDLVRGQRCYRRALALDSRAGDAASGLGMVLLLNGDVDGALSLQLRAAQTHGHVGAVQANLAITAHYAGEDLKRDRALHRAEELGYPSVDGVRQIIA